MSKTLIKTQTVEWKDLNWRKLEKVTFKLQKRIFQASERGDVKAVRKLQKTLINSWSAKCIAVRRVTQDNQGKNTAGIDGVKSLTPEQRMNLVGKLKLTNKVKQTRRVHIPKPGTTETPPQAPRARGVWGGGILTINDRALQALVKLAMEPEWEAKFEPNSYGFRPGRSCHDAIDAIFKSINTKSKYVLDADIAKCFDRINHKALIDKINTYPTLSRLIKLWLKAGYCDGKELFPTNEGTPQGGIISPLLANIALHGMEERVKQYAETLKGGKRLNRTALSLIRYADDFVIMHEDLSVVKKCQEIIADWLGDMGLELKPSKTKLTHTLNEIDGNVGFEFLGFHIQQYKVGNYLSAKNPYGKILGFNTLITPSKAKIKTHLAKIAEVIDAHKTAPQAALISRLNPIIRGWSNYYSTVVSKETFSKVDHLTYNKLRAWARNRGKGNINKDKYWRTVGDRNWCFSTEDGIELTTHNSTPIIRHTKVKGEASPFNGDWIYWSKRRGEYPETPSRVSKLIKRQKGICPECGLYFSSTDIVEVDHIKPKSLGGKDTYNNLQLLHKHCHDTKTAKDGSSTKKGLIPLEQVANYEMNPF
ncbi:group II intron reverse transcriptase/maturase [Planktothrix agardhii 1806]|nr:group II intron reverse transcriptase/maturase [Planktothrix agardhii]MBG0745549.1 group II intron reverse transcriptase/maturase [Planktothrix agardhii KL2]MCB8752217.1 group II intron reverse transcriptase/maturase [Planktothrix agardhii 1810]MCB8761261.1 group II intron reverse transcriptase/maturase [Planktothrix agardhii 1813]MCB8762974.1 group II intron reverse transcriptase/maturase [Planktothrix agardhii 1809]MCB8776570.1 group II intron reverse transcriptase/maturase [Planktothrix 